MDHFGPDTSDTSYTWIPCTRCNVTPCVCLKWRTPFGTCPTCGKCPTCGQR